MQKFRLKNISCASCAIRIEEELKNTPGVSHVSINYSTSILKIDKIDLKNLKKKIKKVEPAVEVEQISERPERNNKAWFSNQYLILFIAIFLFLIGVIFRDELAQTPYNYAEYLVFIIAYLLSGWNVLKKALLNIFHGRVFDENFLMSIATLGAIIIRELPEAVAVMLFYNIGELLQGIAVNNSRKSIKSLMQIRPDYANLLVDGQSKKIDPEAVKIGELILIKPGEKIPLDGEVIEGRSFVDTFALTGESVPRSINKNEIVLAGMINKSGAITVKVLKTFGETTLSKTLELVENASKNKARSEKFITKFARHYTPAVVAIAAAIAFIPPLMYPDQLLTDWVYRALVILVISCPCALVISIPLGYFGGIGGASKKGILVKGSNYLDALTEVNTVVFDKTGTLTKGVFNVSDVIIKNGFSKDEIIQFAAAAEKNSIHPIADSIRRAAEKSPNNFDILEFNEISGEGVKVRTGKHEIIAGNDRLLHSEKIDHDECNVEGTVVHVAVNKKYAGYIIISDEVKDDAAETVQALKDLNINSIMLTGDNYFSSKKIAEKLKINQFFDDLLPNEKVEYFEKIIEENKGKGKVAFVGDGINDAPVIARADVGIAMGGLGSDAAVEAADVVIMKDQPVKVVEAIQIAKKTRKIVWQNIAFAMAVKGVFIILGSFGLAQMWEAVFADMGVALLAILNAARMLKS
jgi:Zn2+/Cd2+-exporting ATPase